MAGRAGAGLIVEADARIGMSRPGGVGRFCLFVGVLLLLLCTCARGGGGTSGHSTELGRELTKERVELQELLDEYDKHRLLQEQGIHRGQSFASATEEDRANDGLGTGDPTARAQSKDVVTYVNEVEQLYNQSMHALGLLHTDPTLQHKLPSQHDIDVATGLTRLCTCALLALCVIVGHKCAVSQQGIFSYINESASHILLGLIAGLVLWVIREEYWIGKHKLLGSFDEDVFFFYLLPPIILNAGYRLNTRRFFRNFVPIFLLGVVGTILSTIITGYTAYQISHTSLWHLEGEGVSPRMGATMITEGHRPPSPLGMAQSLSVGVIMSATDSVATLALIDSETQPMLHSILFGESVVNDATAIVLFHAVRKYAGKGFLSSQTGLGITFDFIFLFTTSIMLGLVVGFMSVALARRLQLSDTSITREVALHMCLAYGGYVQAQVLELSGIVTVFATGMVLSIFQEGKPGNLETARNATANTIKVVSDLAEMFVFCYIGLSAFNYAAPFSTALPIIFILALSFARAAVVGLVCFCTSLCCQSGLSKNQAITIWFAGLVRGAVSFALVLQLKGSRKKLLLMPVLMIVLFTTVVLGALAKPVFALLQASPPHDSDPPSDSRGSDQNLSEPGSERAKIRELPSRFHDQLHAIGSRILGLEQRRPLAVQSSA
mmetsp:Transcript_2042/g.7320  ORF Transcript_2042/g.7320 Transcript_2042/m.7320 type:complete len:664 (+) Transcript_2042:301-2292(+)